MKKKYLIFDLDGTLVDNATKEFFPGAKDTLAELSKIYQLFMSTSSDDEYVKEYLKAQGVYDLFDIVMGGTVMQKSVKHTEVFEMYSEDTNFSQRSVFIGDSEMDEKIAEDSFIPFIQIGDSRKSRYMAQSVNVISDLIRKVR